MLVIRIWVLVILLIGTTSAPAAEDYILPNGVSVLTEEQLFNQIIGSTLSGGNGHWFAYFLPRLGDQKKGGFRGKSVAGVPLAGTGR